jgi:hypothetical protein
MKKFVQKNPTLKTNFRIQSGLSRNAIATLLSVFAIFLSILSLAGTSPSESSAASSPFAAATAGSWAVVSSPNTSDTEHNFLQNVTCVSASDCWAAGTYFAGGAVTQTLIERWDGTSWAIVSSPNAGVTQGNFLYGVKCVSTSECWAVGYYNAASAAQTLIERWDGTSWTIVNSPNTSATRNNFLYGVTCVSASECWAVGGYYTGSANQTLIERWDGISWTIVNSPSTSATEHNVLYGVTCVSASDCWAAGFYNNSLTSNNQTLIERWDGTSWAIVPSPNTLPIQDNHLFAVTCVSGSECWAVGDSVNRTPLGISIQTLIERWDGTSWAIVTSPNASTQGDVLFGVSCRSAADCWAAGYQNTNSVSQTLMEQWDGKSWTVANSADTSATTNPVLHAVTCVPASDCWAVGDYATVTGFRALGRTLTEHYTASTPTPTSVVSRMTHGSITPPFDINLPLTGPRAVECRSSTSLGAGNYTMVFKFPNNLMSVTGASVTGHDPVSGTGTVSSSMVDSSDTHNYIVNLTGVSTGQYITVTLNNVHDIAGNVGDVTGPQMGVLVGDVDASGRVDSTDVFEVRQQTLQPVTSSNFRMDVDASGRIDSTDVFMTRQQTLTSLP